MSLILEIAVTSAAASLTGFASNVTGATWTLTANDSNDNCAHLATIRNDSGTDHSGKTITLVGTAPNGAAQTEDVTGPGAGATVTSTKHYMTLTSAAPSATIGADTFDIGWAAESVTDWVNTNINVPWGGFGFGCYITSGTPTYTVQTGWGGNPIDHATVSAETTSQYGECSMPIQALRLKFTVAGGVTLTGIQAGA